MKKTILAMTLLLAGLSTNANAEFVAGDYLSANDSSVTLDSTTGLEWLSLTLTVNKSINDVSALIDSGEHAGFRLATKDEVTSMYDQFLTEDKSAWLSLDAKSNFIALFGGYQVGERTYYSYGLVKGSGNLVSMYGARELDLNVFRDYHKTLTTSYRTSSYSVYLVSDSGASYSAINDSSYNATRLGNAASVPAPFLLGGLGLLGLAGVKRRSAKPE